MAMRMSDNGKRLLKAWEGAELKEYLDSAGKPTIGVGHLLSEAERASKRLSIGGLSVDYSNGLTESQVLALLAEDLPRYETAVDDAVTVALNPSQFDALAAFCFNIGIGAFKSSTLVRELNAGNHAKVPDELRRWVNAGGKVSRGLVNRRENEIKLWNGELTVA